MRRVPALCAVLSVGLAAAPVLHATDPGPEIRRAAASAQAVGAVHTLRTIPEACARLEGVFTGQAAQPYRFAVVRTSPGCQPRARFVDAAKAAPSTKAGWLLNDVIRVPSATCAGQAAVVQVWRKPGAATPPALDAQGRARLYLSDAKQAAEAGKVAAVPMFAARMTLEGKPCG